MFIRISLIVIGLTLFVFSGCDDENGPSTPQPSMELLEAPAALPSNADVFHTYAVRVNNATPDSILCEVTRPDGTPLASFGLYDDGSWRTFDAPAYASVTSGDVVAGNGTYTRRINGQLLAGGINGSYSFRFVAQGAGNMPGPVTLSVSVAEVSPCLISEYTEVGHFDECFAPMTLEVTMTASDMDRADSVQVWLMDHDNQTIMNVGEFSPTADPALWRYTLDPTFFRCYDPILTFRFLQFRVVTLFGMECSVTQQITYQPHLAVLSNSTLPDTAYRGASPGDSNIISFTVDMDDCELAGATNYYGLEFQARRDPNDWGRASDFYLRDDGVAPDAIAGDNTYSSWLVIKYDSVLTNNMYYFRFYAIEGFAPCVARWDSSEYLLDSVRIIQPGVVALGNDLNPSELGIGVYQLPR